MASAAPSDARGNDDGSLPSDDAEVRKLAPPGYGAGVLQNCCAVLCEPLQVLDDPGWV